MLMRIDRRTALFAVAGTLLFREVRAADAETALFWTVTPPGRKGAVLFGYERIAASLVPDVVRDGNALVDASTRVVTDMPQAVSLPTVGLARNEMKPILQTLSPPTAERLRKFIAATPAASLGDRLGGLEATALLQAEGQQNPNGTVGGVIADHAKSVGKPIDQLLSEDDVKSAWRPPDMAALNNAIGEDTLSYLLDLRDRVGPTGAYLETLYRQRKGEELVRVSAEMGRHGVFSLARVLETDRMRDMMLARAQSVLSEQADEQRFMLFPLGMLCGSSGLLAAFKTKGATVTPRA